MWSILLSLFVFFLYVELTSDREIPCCLSKEYVMMKHIGGLLSLTVMVNAYIGFWELIWRCIYRQWTWPPLQNIKRYGLVSNLCVLGFILPVLGIAGVVALVFGLHYLGV